MKYWSQLYVQQLQFIRLKEFGFAGTEKHKASLDKVLQSVMVYKMDSDRPTCLFYLIIKHD